MRLDNYSKANFKVVEGVEFYSLSFKALEITMEFKLLTAIEQDLMICQQLVKIIPV